MFRNYSELVLCVPLSPYLAELVDADDGEIVLSLSMNISTKEWTVNKLNFVPKPDITAKQRKNPSKGNKFSRITDCHIVSNPFGYLSTQI